MENNEKVRYENEITLLKQKLTEKEDTIIKLREFNRSYTEAKETQDEKMRMLAIENEEFKLKAERLETELRACRERYAELESKKATVKYLDERFSKLDFKMEELLREMQLIGKLEVPKEVKEPEKVVKVRETLNGYTLSDLVKDYEENGYKVGKAMKAKYGCSESAIVSRLKKCGVYLTLEDKRKLKKENESLG